MRTMCLMAVGLLMLAGTVAVAGVAESSTQVVVTSLPENVKLIVGVGKTRNYFERVRAIHTLGTNLPQDQIKAFYQFLYEKLEKQELGDLEFNGLKNELVVKLIQQDSKPPGGYEPRRWKCVTFLT